MRKGRRENVKENKGVKGNEKVIYISTYEW